MAQHDTTYERQHPAFYALIFTLVFMSVGPIALMFINSFKLDVDIISGTTGLLFLPTIQNYETALCDILPYELDHLDYCSLKFGGAFINSIIITLISTVLTLIIGCMAAYALVRFRFMGRDTVSGTTLMVRMVPPAVLLVPVFGLWNNEFCIGRETWMGEIIRDTLGGRGDVCLAGTWTMKLCRIQITNGRFIAIYTRIIPEWVPARQTSPRPPKVSRIISPIQVSLPMQNSLFHRPKTGTSNTAGGTMRTISVVPDTVSRPMKRNRTSA